MCRLPKTELRKRLAPAESYKRDLETALSADLPKILRVRKARELLDLVREIEEIKSELRRRVHQTPPDRRNTSVPDYGPDD